MTWINVAGKYTPIVNLVQGFNIDTIKSQLPPKLEYTETTGSNNDLNNNEYTFTNSSTNFNYLLINRPQYNNITWQAADSNMLTVQNLDNNNTVLNKTVYDTNPVYIVGTAAGAGKFIRTLGDIAKIPSGSSMKRKITVQTPSLETSLKDQCQIFIRTK